MKRFCVASHAGYYSVLLKNKKKLCYIFKILKNCGKKGKVCIVGELGKKPIRIETAR